MDISRLKIGILHSLIGKNDGVSIVIDQTIEAMIDQMEIPLGNIHLLAAHSPPRFNTTLDDIFWHKNEQNKYILAHYSQEPAPDDLEDFILEHANYAKSIIAKFIEKNDIDLFIVHNSCHPSNFVYAVATGMYFEEIHNEGRSLPKFLLWWHDSHFERDRFKKPNSIIRKFLKYLPGPHVNGIVFINTEQELLANRYYAEEFKMANSDLFFKRKTVFIPNTCSIPWDWSHFKLETKKLVAPPEDQYNKTFLKDIGLIKDLEAKGFELEETVILLQHTRVVQRKRIDVSIEFAIRLEEKFRKEGMHKAVALLVSGHSGDEHDSHLMYLKRKFSETVKKFPDSKGRVFLLFAEKYILPEREVLVEKKYYRFADIPAVVARCGGMGTYFSEVEGFGNNLLEMISQGLPVVINKYPIYKRDIEQLGFMLPSVENCKLENSTIDECFQLLTNVTQRNQMVLHNLQVLQEKLHHGVIAEKLSWLIQNMFKYQ